MAAAFTERLGRPVRHVDLSPESQREFLQSVGMDEWTTEAFVELFGIYRAGHGSGISSEPIEQVTGRPARNLTGFLEDYRSRFMGAAVPA